MKKIVTIRVASLTLLLISDTLPIHGLTMWELQPCNRSEAKCQLMYCEREKATTIFGGDLRGEHPGCEAFEKKYRNEQFLKILPIIVFGAAVAAAGLAMAIRYKKSTKKKLKQGSAKKKPIIKK